MIDPREEFSNEFDRYVMHGRFRDSNFTDTVYASDRYHETYHGVEILSRWICNCGFNKRDWQDKELMEDFFLSLNKSVMQDICGAFLMGDPDRAREIYIDCEMHIEGVNENDNV